VFGRLVISGVPKIGDISPTSEKTLILTAKSPVLIAFRRRGQTFYDLAPSVECLSCLAIALLNLFVLKIFPIIYPLLSSGSCYKENTQSENTLGAVV
jgi:hypothetical protein